MKKDGTQRYRAFIPALLYYGVVFFFSSRNFPIPLSAPGADKGLHAAEFILLGLFLAFGWFRVPKASLKLKILGVLSSGFVLGGLDEVHQLFVAGRHADPVDALADTLGVGLGLLIYAWYHRTRGYKKNRPSDEPGLNS